MGIGRNAMPKTGIDKSKVSKQRNVPFEEEAFSIFISNLVQEIDYDIWKEIFLGEDLGETEGFVVKAKEILTKTGLKVIKNV